MGGAEYNFKGCYGGPVGYFLGYDSCYFLVMDTISDPKANFSELGSIVSECRSLQLANCNAYKLHNSLLA